MAENSKPLDPLLDLLVQNGVLDDGQVETILEEAKNPTGKTLRQILIDEKCLSTAPLTDQQKRAQMLFFVAVADQFL